MTIAIDSWGSELEATLQTEGNSKSMPNEMEGRLRVGYFTYTVPVGGEADDNHIALLKLPKGARIMGGNFKTSDMGASSEAVDIGLAAVDGSGYIDAAGTVADDDDKFLAAGAVDDVSNLDFAHTVALGYGYELEKECYLVATVETDAWAAAGTVAGHCYYVID